MTKHLTRLALRIEETALPPSCNFLGRLTSRQRPLSTRGDGGASWLNGSSKHSRGSLSRLVDIWAPGVSILSTKFGAGTQVLSVTSMASPHVAGAGALFLSANPTATPAQVERAIKDRAMQTGTQSKDGRAITRLHVGDF